MKIANDNRNHKQDAFDAWDDLAACLMCIDEKDWGVVCSRMAETINDCSPTHKMILRRE